MFKKLVNNADVAATGTGAQTAIVLGKSPFEPGRTAMVEYHSMNVSGTPVIKCQGSDDGGTTWTDLFTLTTAEALACYVRKNVQLMGQIRMNQTAVGGGGTWTAYLSAPGI